MKKYLVLGASPNTLRHSNKAVKSLLRHNYEAIPVGFRNGTISDLPILTDEPEINNVHTILLYIGAKRQPDYYDYILDLNPKRIVFNPGTENPEFQDIAALNGIEVVVGCALVMINSGQL
jgi:uncharacterized protein